MIRIKTKIELKDINNFDDISVEVSGSVTGFEVLSVQTSHQEGDKFIAEVEGNLLHLDGFEDVSEFERFLD